MGQVWDLDIPHNEAWVLMALTDHADHEGKNVFPGLALLSYKTGYSERQLRRVLASLEQRRIAIPVGGGVGRGQKQGYEINLEAAPRKTDNRTKRPLNGTDKSGHPDTEKADKLAAKHTEKADILTPEKRTFETQKADISGSHIRKNHHEPSIEPPEQQQPEKTITTVLGETYREIIHGQHHQAMLENQIKCLDQATVAEVEEWLSTRKRLPSINYIALDFKTWKAGKAKTNGAKPNEQPRFESAAERSTRRLRERDYDAIAAAAGIQSASAAAD